MSPPKKIVIVGAGDHGRGTLEILKACNHSGLQYEPIGFLDDDIARRGKKIDGVPVIGPLSTAALNGNGREVHYVLAIGNCRTKQLVARRFKGVQFAAVVHPSSVLGSDVVLGDGSIVAAGAVIAYNTVIGRHVTVNLNATVGHDCTIGDYATIAPGANIAGKVRLAEGCDISLNATVVRGTSIGEWTVVGPGAVALRDVPARQCLFGNPGRVVPVRPHN